MRQGQLIRKVTDEIDRAIDALEKRDDAASRYSRCGRGLMPPEAAAFMYLVLGVKEIR